VPTSRIGKGRSLRGLRLNTTTTVSRERVHENGRSPRCRVNANRDREERGRGAGYANTKIAYRCSMRKTETAPGSRRCYPSWRGF